MKSKQKMKIICLDGLKPEYFKYMPNLEERFKGCLRGPLETVFGFTSISASFSTGLYPDKHKIFTIFNFSKKHFTPKLPNHILTLLKNAIRLIQNQRFFYKYYDIPNYALKYFKPSLNKIWYQKDILEYKTLFDYLRKNKISFSYVDFPNFFDGKNSIYLRKSDKATLSKIKKIKSKVCFVFLRELDSLSHKYGPYSDQVIEHVKFLDRELSKIKDDLIIWSDHGFLKVKGTVNLLSYLKKLNLKYGKDYVYFLDSTMARFWFRDEIIKKEVINNLKKIKNGKILTDEEIKEFHIPENQDLLFVCNPAYIVFPNFFDKQKIPKGMHGYNPKIKEQKGFYLISTIEGKEKPAKIIDLFPTILKILKIKEPKNIDGKFLF